MKKLFLDDVRQPYIGFDVVRSYGEFKEYIKTNGCPDFISFDHDLGILATLGQWDKEKTGYDCARWLVEKYGEIPEFFAVHSQNPVGKERIRKYMLMVGSKEL